MSKGLGKLQRAIVGLLDGTIKNQVFSAGDVLATNEILAELTAAGFVDGAVPRKIGMATVRRACQSLVDRGLMTMSYGINCHGNGEDICVWRLIVDATGKKSEADRLSLSP